MQCKAKPISVLVVRLRYKENDIISLTSKNESGGSLAMQGETNLSLGCKIESKKYRDRDDIISLTSKNESGGSLAMQGEANLSFGCKIGSEREI